MRQSTLLFLIFVILLNSCKVFLPNRMFKEGNYEYFQVKTEVLAEYLIQKGDILSLEVFTREGFELVDVLQKTSSSVTNPNATNRYTYLVEHDGYVELPLYGRMQVLGYTVNELEDIIELKSQEMFKDPYAILKVTNRRAFVFKGSNALVISLNEAPTNLLEVIAKSGGLANELKAYKIKIIRGDLKAPEILNIDLSTMEGLKNGDLTIQSNDIIYIERRFKFASELLSELTPILSLTTTVIATIALVTNLSR